MEKKINGNTYGIKHSMLDRMQALFDLSTTKDCFVSSELLDAMAEYTFAINREISAYISRNGEVVEITIGDADSAPLSSLRLNRNDRKLSGVRCIHTHPNGNSRLSDADIGGLERARMDAIAAVGVVDGKANRICCAVLTGQQEGDRLQYREFGPVFVSEIDHDAWMGAIYIADEQFKSETLQEVKGEIERCFLVGVDTGRDKYDTLEELAQLVDTAGAIVVGSDSQRRSEPDNVTYIGKGKAEELIKTATALNVDLFVFDDELSSIQIRNLESILGARVIDRTALILDIFASRATSREGKLQVELAQLKYRLPRLIGFGTSLSRQGAGIGTKGPGEKKLESDRRRIRRQIFELECDIEKMEKQRELRRSRREKNAQPIIALVGYTNAGKSTLLNALSGSDVLAEDRLFATLDPVTRQVELASGEIVLFSDTVGFINKLPHDLVKAFRSTLEEAAKADIIVHVIDASSPYADEQVKIVENVLGDLGIKDQPMIKAYNKSDSVEYDSPLSSADGIRISAKTGEGIDVLITVIEKLLGSGRKTYDIEIPYSRGDVQNFLRRNSKILAEEHGDDGWQISVSTDMATIGIARRMLENA